MAHPVDPHGPLASGVLEDVDAVKWIGMHWTHDPARIVSTNRDQAQIEGTSQLANLPESRTVWIVMLRTVIIDFFRQFGNRPVPCVATEPYFLPTAFHTPAGPESVPLVKP